jgi:hypothetical protein
VDDDLSVLNLDDDYAEVLTTADVARWELTRSGPLEIWASMAPESTPGERYQARLLWSRYPETAPSLKFRDPETGRLELPTAWPQVRGFRPTSFDACVNWCAEGLALHPEWTSDPAYRWDPRGNPLLRVVRTLQDELDHYYGGRFAG